MLTLVEKILFILVVGVSAYGAYITFGRMFAVISRGSGAINWAALPRKLMAGLLALVSQGRIIRHRKLSSIFHYLVAWSFIFYFLVNAADILEGFVDGFRIPGVAGDLYRLLADIASIAGIVAVVYFLLRRFAAGDQALRIRENVTLIEKARSGVPKDSLIVGGFILIHLGFRFLGATFLIGLDGADAWQPFANIVANLWQGMSETGLTVGWHVSWWLALGAILAFLPYFPYTKHAHLFMGPLNYMTRPERTSLGTMSAIDFEDESIEQFGVSTLTDLHQTQILDAFACIMCNRCQEVCPAYVTGKELSPAALEVNKRYYIRENLVALAAGEESPQPLLDYAISESAVWACTSCGACIDVCPVGNEPMHDILDIRRNQVLMESRFPNELKQAYNGIERMANPWNSTESRLAWTSGLPFAVKTAAENPDFEYLFWVGCAGAFEPEAQKVAQAVATVLHEAGVNFAVLGDEETCTGDAARRSGNEYLFYEMAMNNIETLNGYGVGEKKIVTSCPHCFTTLGREYGAYGGSYTVYHHTQMIADLVGAGRLALNGASLEKVTFHDPCYLGRHNGEYDAPRTALSKAGATLMEMDRNRSNSFCCGAGGAQFWKEEEHGSEPVSENRFEEARSTGADTVAVGCPFCAVMLRDANKNAGTPMAVKDVAQVVVEALQKENA